MKSSYLIKAENCLKSAKILFKNNLYENSTYEAYCCMYNSLLSLLFKVGIKSENHSASIILFEKIFENKKLTKLLFLVEKERVDKQYYTETQQITKSTKDSCKKMVLNAEEVLVQMKLIIYETDVKIIERVKKIFEDI